MGLMKKLGCLVLIVVLGICGLLVWSYVTGSKHQTTFYEAVLSGDVNEVTALLHPELEKQVGKQQLVDFMAAMKQNLGALKGLSKTDFFLTENTEGGVTTTISKGTVEFEKGDVKSRLIFLDGKIAEIEVTSDKLPTPFRVGSPAILYSARGAKFLEMLLSGQEEKAYELLHESARKELPLEKLRPILTATAEKVGALKSVTFASEQFAAGAVKTVNLTYDLTFERRKTRAVVTYQFPEDVGVLIGFNLNPN